jgi:hypothetical protein
MSIFKNGLFLESVIFSQYLDRSSVFLEVIKEEFRPDFAEPSFEMPLMEFGFAPAGFGQFLQRDEFRLQAECTGGFDGGLVGRGVDPSGIVSCRHMRQEVALARVQSQYARGSDPDSSEGRVFKWRTAEVPSDDGSLS